MQITSHSSFWSLEWFTVIHSSLFLIYGLFEDAVNGAATNGERQDVKFKLRVWRDCGENVHGLIKGTIRAVA